MILLAIRLFMAMLASSYVTMGVVAEERASQLWWSYALVQFILAMVSICGDLIRRAKYRRA